MILSDKQATNLLMVLKDTFKVGDDEDAFGLNYEGRRQLFNEIINQQGNKLVNLAPIQEEETEDEDEYEDAPDDANDEKEEKADEE